MRIGCGSNGSGGRVKVVIKVWLLPDSFLLLAALLLLPAVVPSQDQIAIAACTAADISH